MTKQEQIEHDKAVKAAEKAAKIAARQADMEAKKAAKAAEKASKAAETQAHKDAVRANKVTRITEPNPEAIPASPDEPLEKKVVKLGAETNTLDKNTSQVLAAISKAVEVSQNTNTEANIQDQICSIIRQGLRAYELHTGHPFDTEIG